MGGGGPPWHEHSLCPSRAWVGRGPKGSQGSNRATLLTSCCSVLAAKETDGDTSGFGACVSCSPAEPICENKTRNLVGRRELPQKSHRLHGLYHWGPTVPHSPVLPSHPIRAHLTHSCTAFPEDHYPWHSKTEVVTDCVVCQVTVIAKGQRPPASPSTRSSDCPLSLLPLI